MDRTEHKAEDSTPPHRKPYEKPRLRSYGHVKDIVQGGGGTKNNDGGPGGASTKPCWIAEALYGVDAPRTLLLRGWLVRAYDQKRRGWPLISLYKWFGPRLADLIQTRRIPSWPFARLFGYLVIRANDDTARMLKRGR